MYYLSQKLTNFLTTLGINSDVVFFGNSVLEYIISIILLIVLLIIFGIFQSVLVHQLKKVTQKTKTEIDDTFIKIVQSFRPSFYFFLGFYISIRTLNISNLLLQLMNAILIIWVVYQAINAIQILINYLIERRFERSDDVDTRTAFTMVGRLSKWMMWVIGSLLILSNLGINITSLIAGLGIGGIAIAFALQNILTDLFSSFAIYFDKPFLVGDFIEVGEHGGVVEKIGVKSTRIRSKTGEELIISNKELTSARIQNFKRISERRDNFAIGVTYDTSKEKLHDIPKMIQKIVESVENTRFDRVHLKNFSSSSLDFEISYFVKTANYSDFLNAKQEINLKIIELFKNENIEFAYPTQTVYLNK